MKKKIKPPFLPKVKSSTDVSNFDTEFTDCDVESYQDTIGSPAGKVYHEFSYTNDVLNKAN